MTYYWDQIATINNISDIKQAEMEIKKLRNYLANIIDSMPSILVGVDKDARITQWNRRAEEITNLSAENAISRHLDQISLRIGAKMDSVRAVLSDGCVRKDSKIARQTDQGKVYEDVTIYPLMENGVKGAVIRVDDVTEQVRMEEMVVQSEKMLSIGGLAAGMAHEINNPLSAMLQTADVMTRRMTGDLKANDKAAQECDISIKSLHCFMEKREIPRMLETIKTSGIRAAEIVKNMLTFARKNEDSLSSYSLAELLDQTINLAATDYNLKKDYDFKQIKIIREYEKKLSGVLCEGQKIQQVFFNILKNGAQAMHGQRLKNKNLPSPVFRLRIQSDDEMVLVEITDNGPGMGSDTCKRVFEPFFTTKKPGLGTGLGLSVSYFIVTRNHKGSMTVDSIPGKGTSFFIRLPIQGPNKTK